MGAASSTLIRGTRLYDPLRVTTVRVSRHGESHRIKRGADVTLCGVPAKDAQLTLDPRATCGWCRLIEKTRA